ncbi:MAG: hypothetical protein IKR92_03640 [Alphaproteobacteria bacterium]|nr:hypothetical protein [Alphaproteobacteria bacterium]
MKEKNKIFELINQEKVDELFACVFEQTLPNSEGKGTYTQVLTAEEETVVVRKMLTKNGHEADPWLEFIQQYSRKYPLSNRAVQVLLDHTDDPKSIPLLIDVLSAFGYNEDQGIALCNFVLTDSQHPDVLRILQLLYERARVFSPDVYRLLEKIDGRVHEAGYSEQAQFAESYKQAIESQRQIGNKRDFI